MCTELEVFLNEDNEFFAIDHALFPIKIKAQELSNNYIMIGNVNDKDCGGWRPIHEADIVRKEKQEDSAFVKLIKRIFK